MSLTPLSTDLNVHQGLPDRPNANEGLTAAELKVLFDQAPNDIKTYINDVLLAELQAVTGAGNIGATAPSGLSGANVQALLVALKNKIDSVNPVVGFYNVKDPQYGAVGDGITDDTIAIQSAYHALVAGGGGILFFPVGVYLMNLTVDEDRVIIAGCGVDSQLKPADDSIPVLSVTKGRDTNQNYVTVKDIHVSNAAEGIRLWNTHEWLLDNVVIAGCTTGLNIIGSWNGKANKVVATTCTTGIIVETSSFTDGTEQNAASITFDTCFVKDNSTGYLFKTGTFGTSDNALVTIIGGDCEGNTAKGFDIQCIIRQLMIINAHTEFNGTDLYSANKNSNIIIRGIGVNPLNINGLGVIDIDGLITSVNGNKVADLSDFTRYNIRGMELAQAPLSGNTGSSYIVETKNIYGISGTGNLIKDGLFLYDVVSNDNWLPHIIAIGDLTASATYTSVTGLKGRQLTLDCSALAANAGLYQRFEADIGEIVTVHVWAKVSDALKPAIIDIKADTTANFSQIRVSDTTLKRYTLQYRVPADATNDPYIVIRDELGGGNFSVGEVVVHKSGDLTGYLYNEEDIRYDSYVSIYAASNQAISALTDTKLVLDTEEYDNQNEFDSNRFTASRSGIYSVSVGIRWDAQVDGNTTKLTLYKNGTAYKVLDSGVVGGANNSTLKGNIDIVLYKGEYIEFFVLTVNAENVLGGSSNTFATIRYSGR